MVNANNASNEELTKYNVISSRIRLARNVNGIPFSKCGATKDERYMDVIKGAALATEHLFDVDIYLMNRLSRPQKTALVERHMISLPLANNDFSGAVIIERETNSISIMLNEEDHIREQCVVPGFDLYKAYQRLYEYDDNLIKTLDIAYDDELGFITACPSNLGTGMRASCMLFLPALKRMGAIDDTLNRFKKAYNLTIRGVFGEGSESFCDMYQVSNSITLGKSEEQILKEVGDAVLDLCYLERMALEQLVERESTPLLDKISRSYAILSGGAYSLSSEELVNLIVDVKLGMILEVLPSTLDIKVIDKLSEFVSPSTYEITNPSSTEEEQSILRAKLVKKVFLGEK